MKKLSLLLLITCLFVTGISSAQQDPQYTQYMYNMNVVNPAYAGSKETLSITALYRKQWSGLEGAPETMTLSAHSPMGDKVGLGLSAIRDQLGPVKETNVYADFSYTLQVSESLRLALGIKAGATFHDVGLMDLEVQDEGDSVFTSGNINNVYPNVGAGAFFYGDNFYIGFSVPNFLKSTHLEAENLQGQSTDYGSEVNHYFATAGYVFQMSDNWKLKPSAMVKSAFGAPVSFDVNLNALFFEKFEIGASYRYEDSFSGLVGFQVAPFLRVGYAYDHVTSELDVVTNASHEVIVTFDLLFKQKALRSPRYF